jgi:hypothetical protein
METKMFSVLSVRWLYHEYEASSTQYSDSWEVGQFSTSQYEDCSELVTQQEAQKQDSELGLGAQKKIRGKPVKN